MLGFKLAELHADPLAHTLILLALTMLSLGAAMALVSIVREIVKK